ncbi:MAG: transposase [Anaerolineae bacterium]
MKSSTPEPTREDGAAIPTPTLTDAEWERIRQLLSVDLEATARATGALTRRRQVRCASDLLRIVLAYAVCDFSLRLLGVWCVLRGLGNLSDVALRKRVRQSRRWLGTLVVAVLCQRRLMVQTLPAVRLRLIDATSLSRPGSSGTTWRVHLSLDLGRLCLDAIDVTDAHGAESLVRFSPDPQAIQIADGGYSYRFSLESALNVAAPLIVRWHVGRCRLDDDQGVRLDVLAWLRRSETTATHRECGVRLTDAPDVMPLRLIVAAVPSEAAERARRRVRSIASRKGYTPSQDSLYAAGFVMLLTNLPPADYSAPLCLALYRLRWQIELAIKRLKSVLDLDELRAHDAEMAQSYLLAKLLAALCLEAVTAGGATPLDDWLADAQRPLSAWRWTVLTWDALRSSVRGSLALADVLAALPKLRRFLCDAPRRRRQHAAAARVWLASLVTC